MHDSTLPHECTMIADYPTHNDRRIWVGRLTAPLPESPDETHCLHLETPLRKVTLFVNASDAGWLAVVAAVVQGAPVNPRWVKRIIERSRVK